MIRPATTADAAALARVHVETWQLAYAHIFPSDALAGIESARTEERWRSMLTTPERGTRILVSEEAQVFGFAALGPARDDRELGEVYALYVHPDSWGRGFGRALLRESLALLRGDGFGHAILWVLAENHRGRGFYEACGWRADGASKEEKRLGQAVREVRYRTAL